MNFGLGGYIAIGVAIVVGLLLWRNWSLGNERDMALQKVGAQQVVIGQLKQNVEFAAGTVEKWKTASEIFGEAVAEQSRVTYISTQERRKLNEEFRNVDAPAEALVDPRGLQSRRNAGWERLNCLLKSGSSGRGSCPAGPSAAGEKAQTPAPAVP